MLKKLLLTTSFATLSFSALAGTVTITSDTSKPTTVYGISVEAKEAGCLVQHSPSSTVSKEHLKLLNSKECNSFYIKRGTLNEKGSTLTFAPPVGQFPVSIVVNSHGAAECPGNRDATVFTSGKSTTLKKVTGFSMGTGIKCTATKDYVSSTPSVPAAEKKSFFRPGFKRS